MRLTVRDAAALLQVAESEILLGIRDGSLPAHKLRERYMVNGVELLEWAGGRGIPLSAAMLETLESGSVTLAAALERGGIHPDVPGADREAVLRRDRKRIEDERNRLSAAVESAAESPCENPPGLGRQPLHSQGIPALAADTCSTVRRTDRDLAEGT